MSAPGVELGAVERSAELHGSQLRYWVYRPDLGPDAGGPDGADVEPLIVMVHGFRGTHHGLQPLVEHLPTRCVVIPDLPGFGDSTPMTGNRHDVAGYAEVITSLIQHLGARPVVLLGHSFGSLVAARVAASAPEFVRSLVLVNPISSPALDGPRLQAQVTRAYHACARMLPARGGHALLSNKLVVLGASRAMMRTKDKLIRRFVYDNHLRYFSRFHSPALLNEVYEASISHTVMADAGALSMPTLLIAGETDEIAPLAGQRALVAVLERGQLVVIPDVGHLVHYETPRTAATEIERFLSARGEQ